MHKKSLYTLILLKNYEQLKQVRCTPLTFWSVVTLFLFFFFLCFASLAVTFFIWKNSITVSLEKDALYKQYVITEARLNRLLAFEAIILKEKDHLTTRKNNTTKQEVVDKNNTKLAKAIKEAVLQAKTEPTLPTSPATQNFKEVTSTQIVLQNPSLTQQSSALLVTFELHNKQTKKATGTIVYTIVTKNNQTYTATPAKQNDAQYAIRSFKQVRATLALPSAVKADEVASVRVVLHNNGKVVVAKNIEKQ